MLERSFGHVLLQANVVLTHEGNTCRVLWRLSFQFVYMYICIYVYMYICIYVYMYICIYVVFLYVYM